MTARARKLLGSVAMLAFLAGYVVLAATLADRIPNRPLVKLTFFALVGVFWGAPLIPLIRWMNRGS